MPSGASPRDTRTRAARTLSAWGHMVLDAVPGAELLQRRLAVFAGRYGIDIFPSRDAPTPALRRGRSQNGCRPGVAASFGAMRDDRITEKVHDRIGLDRPLFCSHTPSNRGRLKKKRSAGAPSSICFRQHVRSCVRDLGGRMASLGPARSRIIERVLEASGREDHRACRLCSRCTVGTKRLSEKPGARTVPPPSRKCRRVITMSLSPTCVIPDSTIAQDGWRPWRDEAVPR